jgi:hypothetical protein
VSNANCANTAKSAKRIQKIASFAPFALGHRDFRKVPLAANFPIYNNVIVVYNAPQFIERYEEGFFFPELKFFKRVASDSHELPSNSKIEQVGQI